MPRRKESTDVPVDQLFGVDQPNPPLSRAQQAAMDLCYQWHEAEQRQKQAEADRQAEIDRQQAARAEAGHVRWTWDPVTKSVVAK